MADQRNQNEESSEQRDGHGATGHGGNGGGSHGHGGGGHGGGDHEEHEGAPEWLISFADNVMLQMGFFVILLALAMKAPGGRTAGKGEEGEKKGGPTAEQLDFAIAIRDAFNNPVLIESTDPHDAPLVQRLRNRARGDRDAQQAGLKGSDRDVESIREGGLIGAGGSIPFESGARELTEAGRTAAEELADRFRGCHTMLELRGHCSAAEAFAQDDRGMALSYERALAVAQVLVSKGLPWTRLRLIACADNDRVTSLAYSDAEHRSNQRVEVIEVPEAAPAQP